MSFVWLIFKRVGSEIKNIKTVYICKVFEFLLLLLGPAAYGLRDLLGSAPKYSLYARRSSKDKFKVRLFTSFFILRKV